MKQIPVFNIDKDTPIGLNVRYVTSDNDWGEIADFPIHRNENYLFILNEHGTGNMEVDFELVEMKAGQIGFIAPGQVHHTIRAEKSSCWLISVYPHLIDEEYLSVFDNFDNCGRPINLEETAAAEMAATLKLLQHAIKGDPDAWKYKRLVYTLFNAFMCEVADAIQCSANNLPNQESRKRQIARSFCKLIENSFIIQKSPTYYASCLNITPAYLNECAKAITGTNAGKIIQNRIILEAKRILVYTKYTVKEVAHRLGYEDHAYFARLFKKSTGITPLEFRHNYHD